MGLGERQRGDRSLVLAEQAHLGVAERGLRDIPHLLYEVRTYTYICQACTAQQSGGRSLVSLFGQVSFRSEL